MSTLHQYFLPYRYRLICDLLEKIMEEVSSIGISLDVEPAFLWETSVDGRSRNRDNKVSCFWNGRMLFVCMAARHAEKRGCGWSAMSRCVDATFFRWTLYREVCVDIYLLELYWDLCTWRLILAIIMQ